MSTEGRPDRTTILGEGQLLQSIVAHWIHEDIMFWTQIRHLFTIQFALLAAVAASAANYIFQGTNFKHALILAFAGLLALVACAASYLLHRLSQRIVANRDINIQLIEPLSRHLATNDLIDIVSQLQPAIRDYSKEFMRLSTHSLGDSNDVGKIFQEVVFRACVAFDLALGVTLLVSAAYLAGLR